MRAGWCISGHTHRRARRHMKLHCAIPLLVSFKSVLQRPTPSLGDPEPVYTRRNLLGSVCYGGGGGGLSRICGESRCTFLTPLALGTCQVFPTIHPQVRSISSNSGPGECIPGCVTPALTSLVCEGTDRQEAGQGQDPQTMRKCRPTSCVFHLLLQAPGTA